MKAKVIVKKKVKPEPREWQLVLYRATDAKIGTAEGPDTYARFGRQWANDNSKSFGWIYVPLDKAKDMKSLVVKVVEIPATKKL